MKQESRKIEEIFWKTKLKRHRVDTSKQYEEFVTIRKKRKDEKTPARNHSIRCFRRRYSKPEQISLYSRVFIVDFEHANQYLLGSLI